MPSRIYTVINKQAFHSIKSKVSSLIFKVTTDVLSKSSCSIQDFVASSIYSITKLGAIRSCMTLKIVLSHISSVVFSNITE